MPTKPSPDPKLDLLQLVVRALDDKKAEDLRVMHVSEQSSITDYLVLANGNSEPHLRALRIEVEKVLDANEQPIAGMEGGGFNSGWTVVDAYQIMVHLFTTEQREHYALDKLWRDAEELPIKKLLQPEKPAKAVAPTKKAAAKKAAPRAAKKSSTPEAKAAVAKKRAPAKKRAKKAT